LLKSLFVPKEYEMRKTTESELKNFVDRIAAKTHSNIYILIR